MNDDKLKRIEKYIRSVLKLYHHLYHTADKRYLPKLSNTLETILEFIDEIPPQDEKKDTMEDNLTLSESDDDFAKALRGENTPKPVKKEKIKTMNLYKAFVKNDKQDFMHYVVAESFQEVDDKVVKLYSQAGKYLLTITKMEYITTSSKNGLSKDIVIKDFDLIL